LISSDNRQTEKILFTNFYFLVDDKQKKQLQLLLLLLLSNERWLVGVSVAGGLF
jgi:hypothetical protein